MESFGELVAFVTAHAGEFLAIVGALVTAATAAMVALRGFVEAASRLADWLYLKSVLTETRVDDKIAIGFVNACELAGRGLDKATEVSLKATSLLERWSVVKDGSRGRR